MAGTSERIEAARAQVDGLGAECAGGPAEHVERPAEDAARRHRGARSLSPTPSRAGVLATIDSVVRSANRGNVSIYPIDPPINRRNVPAERRLLGLAERHAGGTIVRPTAGRANLGRAAVRRGAAPTQAAYYMLTYVQGPHEDGTVPSRRGAE